MLTLNAKRCAWLYRRRQKVVSSNNVDVVTDTERHLLCERKHKLYARARGNPALLRHRAQVGQWAAPRRPPPPRPPRRPARAVAQPRERALT